MIMRKQIELKYVILLIIFRDNNLYQVFSSLCLVKSTLYEIYI